MWRSVTSAQNMTSATSIVCSGDHVHLAVRGGCLDEAPFVCYGVRYSVECEYQQLWSV